MKFLFVLAQLGAAVGCVNKQGSKKFGLCSSAEAGIVLFFC